MIDLRNKIECPCCHGERVLRVIDERYPKERARREPCCHCSGRGFVFTDNRSDNTYE